MHEATRRILSTLLRRIDSFESNHNILTIIATNRKDDLDAALVSRVDLSIKFDFPCEESRKKIFQRYAKHLNAAQLFTLAKSREGLSGRDIADICKSIHLICLNVLDVERKWASKYVREQAQKLEPDFELYQACTQIRIEQMKKKTIP